MGTLITSLQLKNNNPTGGAANQTKKAGALLCA